VLCCAVLCCAVLCCAVLCCAVLCCTVLCRALTPIHSPTQNTITNPNNKREWPVEALSGVARSFLADVDLGGAPVINKTAAGAESESAVSAAAASGGGLEGVVSCCVVIHRSVEARSKRYYEELRRCAGPCSWWLVGWSDCWRLCLSSVPTSVPANCPLETHTHNQPTNPHPPTAGTTTSPPPATWSSSPPSSSCSARSALRRPLKSGGWRWGWRSSPPRLSRCVDGGLGLCFDYRNNHS